MGQSPGRHPLQRGSRQAEGGSPERRYRASRGEPRPYGERYDVAGFGDSFSDGDVAGDDVTTAAAAGRGEVALLAGERDLLLSVVGLVTDSYGLKLTLERFAAWVAVCEDCED